VAFRASSRADHAADVRHERAAHCGRQRDAIVDGDVEHRYFVLGAVIM
jgi:hypothetical protein